MLLLLGSISPVTVQAQTKKEKKAQKAAEVKELVDSRTYIFTPQTMLPASGRSRQVTPDFEFRVLGDSIVSYLPYFGRAFSAPINPNQGGLTFRSTDFDYTLADAKKGGWDITIRPKDVPDVQRIQLSIQESGYAYMQVISTNRQPIAFNGILSARTDRN